MTYYQILSYVDHTQLKPYCTWEDIRQLCDEAMEYQTASVCIPPSYVQRVNKEYPDLTICTVIGFPLGYMTTEAKEFETRDALLSGADEIDMVINVGDVKNGDYDKVMKEIAAIKKVCGKHILKVIVETCYLTEEEKVRLCEIVTQAGADFIKTSTGFGTGGATVEDIRLFKEHIGENVQMKAAGGIRSVQDMEIFLEEGCMRLGTSSAVKLVKDETEG